MVIPAILLLIVALAALALIPAMRGRRVDDYPVCRGCGFDLFGLPLGSTTCSECGANLSRPRAVRRGNRRRRPWQAAIALALLLSATAGLGTVAYRAVPWGDLEQHKPTWWLLRHISSPTAQAELMRRFEADALSESQVGRLAERALDLMTVPPANRAASFGNIEWCAVVRRAHALGKISDERLESYWRSAVPLRLIASPGAGADRRLTVNVGCDQYDSQRVVQVTYRVIRLRIGAAECDPMDLGGDVFNMPGWSFRGGGSGGGAVPLVRVPPAEAPGGPQPVRCTFDVAVSERPSGSPPRVLARGQVDVQVPVVLPPGLLPLQLIRPSTGDPRPPPAVTAAEVRVGRDPADETRFLMAVDIEGPPPDVDLVFDVSANNPGEFVGYSLGLLICRRGVPIRATLRQQTVGGLGDSKDVRLQPNAQAAADAGFRTIWGGEIVLPGIPMRLIDRP